MVEIFAYEEIPDFPWMMPVEVMHGSLPILGYIISDEKEGYERLAYLTDCKTVTQTSMNLLKGVEFLITSCLQFKPHPSHLIASEINGMISEISPGFTYLTHMAHEFTHDELIEYIASNKIPNCSPLWDGFEIELVEL